MMERGFLPPQTVHSVGDDYPTTLLEARDPPCLSLYQPTHRSHPDNRQDPIRFRNLAKELEAAVRESTWGHDIGTVLDGFHALAADEDFWNHTLDGLAVLAAPGFFRAYHLQRPVTELIVVSDSFHLKPLMRIVQSADRYQVLGVSRREIRLFEGNRDALDEIEPAPGVPRTIIDALGAELTEPHVTVASYGSGPGGPGMHHGHGSKKDEVDSDAERFFRAVDRAVLEHHSRPTGLPLVLAALPENEAVFRAVSHNAQLVEEGVAVSPDAVSIDDLRARSWRVLEPRYLARLASIVEDFGRARAGALGADDVADIAHAAVAGRVSLLLIEADREVRGTLDRTTGRIEFANLADPRADDLLDDIGEVVMKMGGEVVIVPETRMPTRTGVAAIYRF